MDSGPRPPDSSGTAQPSFLTVDRASYNRDASGAGQINMSATTLQNVNISLTVSGTGFASPVVMTPDTATPFPGSKHLASIPFTSLPASVLLDNSIDPAAVLPYTIPLVDEVSISQAIFNPLTRTLTIKAASRDKMAPLPTLTAVDFATPNQFDATGTFTTTLAANPPATVTVMSSHGGSATAPVNIVPQQTLPVSVTLSADKSSPQVVSTPVTFLAVGSGGSGSYEFRFKFFNGTTWSLVQDYSTTATWTLPGNTVAGTYTVAVDIRNAGSTVNRDAVAYSGFQVIVQPPPPVAGVTVIADQATPHNAGTPVTFTASGIGGSGSYEYRFQLFNGTTWSLVQNYSQLATWTLPATASTGNYTLAVEVRNAGSTVNRDVVVYTPYVIQ